jgi:hypothetical protein
VAAGDLTSLASVKAWLGIDSANTGSDALLSSMITSSSRSLLSYMSRAIILPYTWSERYDGRSCGSRIFLRNWPVISVSSLIVDGLTLSATDPNLPRLGYVLSTGISHPPGQPQFLDLFGVTSGRGSQNISVVYNAGYQVSGEVSVVPVGGGTVTPVQALGAWASDSGVKYTLSGASLVKVTTAPGAGQYSVSASGVYTFSAADQNQTVSVSYGYIPSDLAQACVELAGSRFKAGDRVGVASKSVGGQETVSYDLSAMPKSTLMMIGAYRRVSF